jgi:hypothetical protein
MPWDAKPPVRLEFRSTASGMQYWSLCCRVDGHISIEMRVRRDVGDHSRSFYVWVDGDYRRLVGPYDDQPEPFSCWFFPDGAEVWEAARWLERHWSALGLIVDMGTTS